MTESSGGNELFWEPFPEIQEAFPGHGIYRNSFPLTPCLSNWQRGHSPHTPAYRSGKAVLRFLPPKSDGHPHAMDPKGHPEMSVTFGETRMLFLGAMLTPDYSWDETFGVPTVVHGTP